jgi:hypothetical protein
MSNTRQLIGERAALKGLISHTITDFEEDGLTTARTYALYKNNALQNLSLPAITSTNDYMCRYCQNLESAEVPLATNIKQYSFSYCSSLSDIDLSAVTTVGGCAMEYCKSLNSVNSQSVTSVSSYSFNHAGIGKLVLPSLSSTTGNTFCGCRLSTIDLLNPSSIATNTFNSSYSLCHLILRKSSVCTLSSTSAFTNTAIANGIGWIYVPTDLVDEYKAASNWSTYASQITSIDTYPRQLQDETINDTWDDIIAACNNGTYSTAYSLGDIKYLDIGDTKVAMEIVAFDSDETESGGTSHITFISHGYFDYWRMNPTATTEGGWEDCELRSFLRGTIFNQIESSVKAAILPVTKTYTTYVNNSFVTNSTTDTIWIPSQREICYTSANYAESSGATYTTYFTDNSSRIKKYGRSTAANTWRLRSATSPTAFGAIGSSGGNSSDTASHSCGVVLGFCL